MGIGNNWREKAKYRGSEENMELTELQKQITEPDRECEARAEKHWMQLAKPLSGLGKFETMVTQIAGIQRTDQIRLHKKALLVFCADNGVVEEGVTQTGQDVTAVVAGNFLKGETTACKMAQIAGVDLFPIDIGMIRDVEGVSRPEDKVAYGTKNMAKEPAMTRKEAWNAIETGIRKAKERKAEGYQILLTGEMGIGNTTAASAITAVMLNRPVEQVTGRGAGLTGEGVRRKVQVIQRAVEINQPDRRDPLDVLAKVGSLDIAGMCGAMLGAALMQMPVVLDGALSMTAALLAVALVPACRSYLIASHVSKEPSCQLLKESLYLDPVLNADMNLGEGTGAVALMPLLDMAAKVYFEMPTFEGIEIKPYEVLK